MLHGEKNSNPCNRLRGADPLRSKPILWTYKKCTPTKSTKKQSGNSDNIIIDYTYKKEIPRKISYHRRKGKKLLRDIWSRAKLKEELTKRKEPVGLDESSFTSMTREKRALDLYILKMFGIPDKFYPDKAEKHTQYVPFDLTCQLGDGTTLVCPVIAPCLFKKFLECSSHSISTITTQHNSEVTIMSGDDLIASRLYNSDEEIYDSSFGNLLERGSSQLGTSTMEVSSLASVNVQYKNQSSVFYNMLLVPEVDFGTTYETSVRKMMTAQQNEESLSTVGQMASSKMGQSATKTEKSEEINKLKEYTSLLKSLEVPKKMDVEGEDYEGEDLVSAKFDKGGTSSRICYMKKLKQYAETSLHSVKQNEVSDSMQLKTESIDNLSAAVDESERKNEMEDSSCSLLAEIKHLAEIPGKSSDLWKEVVLIITLLEDICKRGRTENKKVTPYKKDRIQNWLSDALGKIFAKIKRKQEDEVSSDVLNVFKDVTKRLHQLPSHNASIRRAQQNVLQQALAKKHHIPTVESIDKMRKYEEYLYCEIDDTSSEEQNSEFQSHRVHDYMPYGLELNPKLLDRYKTDVNLRYSFEKVSEEKNLDDKYRGVEGHLEIVAPIVELPLEEYLATTFGLSINEIQLLEKLRKKCLFPKDIKGFGRSLVLIILDSDPFYRVYIAKAAMRDEGTAFQVKEKLDTQERKCLLTKEALMKIKKMFEKESNQVRCYLITSEFVGDVEKAYDNFNDVYGPFIIDVKKVYDKDLSLNLVSVSKNFHIIPGVSGDQVYREDINEYSVLQGMPSRVSISSNLQSVLQPATQDSCEKEALEIISGRKSSLIEHFEKIKDVVPSLRMRKRKVFDISRISVPSKVCNVMERMIRNKLQQNRRIANSDMIRNLKTRINKKKSCSFLKIKPFNDGLIVGLEKGAGEGKYRRQFPSTILHLPIAAEAPGVLRLRPPPDWHERLKRSDVVNLVCGLPRGKDLFPESFLLLAVRRLVPFIMAHHGQDIHDNQERIMSSLGDQFDKKVASILDYRMKLFYAFWNILRDIILDCQPLPGYMTVAEEARTDWNPLHFEMVVYEEWFKRQGLTPPEYLHKKVLHASSSSSDEEEIVVYENDEFVTKSKRDYLRSRRQEKSNLIIPNSSDPKSVAQSKSGGGVADITCPYCQTSESIESWCMCNLVDINIKEAICSLSQKTKIEETAQEGTKVYTDSLYSLIKWILEGMVFLEEAVSELKQEQYTLYSDIMCDAFDICKQKREKTPIQKCETTFSYVHYLQARKLRTKPPRNLTWSSKNLDSKMSMKTSQNEGEFECRSVSVVAHAELDVKQWKNYIIEGYKKYAKIVKKIYKYYKFKSEGSLLKAISFQYKNIRHLEKKEYQEKGKQNLARDGQSICKLVIECPDEKMFNQERLKSSIRELNLHNRKTLPWNQSYLSDSQFCTLSLRQRSNLILGSLKYLKVISKDYCFPKEHVTGNSHKMVFQAFCKHYNGRSQPAVTYTMGVVQKPGLATSPEIDAGCSIYTSEYFAINCLKLITVATEPRIRKLLKPHIRTFQYRLFSTSKRMRTICGQPYTKPTRGSWRFWRLRNYLSEVGYPEPGMGSSEYFYWDLYDDINDIIVLPTQYKLMYYSHRFVNTFPRRSITDFDGMTIAPNQLFSGLTLTFFKIKNNGLLYTTFILRPSRAYILFKPRSCLGLRWCYYRRVCSSYLDFSYIRIPIHILFTYRDPFLIWVEDNFQISNFKIFLRSTIMKFAIPEEDMNLNEKIIMYGDVSNLENLLVIDVGGLNYLESEEASKTSEESEEGEVWRSCVRPLEKRYTAVGLKALRDFWYDVPQNESSSSDSEVNNNICRGYSKWDRSETNRYYTDVKSRVKSWIDDSQIIYEFEGTSEEELEKVVKDKSNEDEEILSRIKAAKKYHIMDKSVHQLDYKVKLYPGENIMFYGLKDMRREKWDPPKIQQEKPKELYDLTDNNSEHPYEVGSYSPGYGFCISLEVIAERIKDRAKFEKERRLKNLAESEIFFKKIDESLEEKSELNVPIEHEEIKGRKKHQDDTEEMEDEGEDDEDTDSDKIPLLVDVRRSELGMDGYPREEDEMGEGRPEAEEEIPEGEPEPEAESGATAQESSQEEQPAAEQQPEEAASYYYRERIEEIQSEPSTLEDFKKQYQYFDIDDLVGDERLLDKKELKRRVNRKAYQKLDLHHLYIRKCKFPLSVAYKNVYHKIAFRYVKDKIDIMENKKEEQNKVWQVLRRKQIPANFKRNLCNFSFPILEILEKRYRMRDWDLSKPESDYRPVSKYFGTDYSHFLPLEMFDQADTSDREGPDLLEDAYGVKNAPFLCLGLAFIPQIRQHSLLPPYHDRVRCAYSWQRVAIYHYNLSEQLFQVFSVNLLSGPYFVSRTYLVFRSENNTTAARRILSAIEMRNKVEMSIRNSLFLLMTPAEDVPLVPQLNAMLDDLCHIPKKQKRRLYWRKLMALERPDWISMLNYERHRKYARDIRELFMKKLNFYRKLCKKWKHFIYYRLISRDQPRYRQKLDTGLSSYIISWRTFYSIYLFSRENIYDLYNILMDLIFELSDGNSLMEMDNVRYKTVEEFKEAMDGQRIGTQSYLSGHFRNLIINSVVSFLEPFYKGYYDIYWNSTLWYHCTKTSRLLKLFKLLIEGSFKRLLARSLKNYATAFEICTEKMTDVNDEFKWGDDLASTRYTSRDKPIFRLKIRLDIDLGAYFNENLNIYEDVIVGMITKAVLMLHDIAEIEPFVHKKLLFGRVTNFFGTGLKDAVVVQATDRVSASVRIGLNAIRAYVKEFERFLPLWKLAPDEYCLEYSQANHSAIEIRDEIVNQMTEANNLKTMLPDSLEVGMFELSMQVVKENLIEKRNNIAQLHLDFYANKMRTLMKDALEEYRRVIHRLEQEPNSIEDLVEMREWLETLPTWVTSHSTYVHKLCWEYYLLDFFKYEVAEVDFKQKWEAKIWPKKILSEIKQVKKELTKLTAKFKKIQVENEVNLSDKIEYLTTLVTNIAKQDDINKVDEVAVDVDKVWAQMREVMEYALLLNERQLLFRMKVTPFDDLNSLIREFEPYKTLWLTSSDWRNSYKTYMENPIMNIKVDTIEFMVNDNYRMISKCARAFHDMPGCQQIALTIKEEIEKFKVFIPLMQHLRNPGMRERHWDELYNQIGIRIILNPNITFSEILETGIGEHRPEIKLISEKANKEYVIEQAIEKIRSEWEDAKLSVNPYKNTGTYIMKIAEEYMQQMEDHMLVIQQLAYSPFKGPFEGMIEDWETTIKLVMSVIEEWIEVQKQWMYLEPIFTSPDISTQLPLENKKFQIVQRSWKRIMNNAFNNPLIIEIAADIRLLDQLQKSNETLESVARGLAEYLESKRKAFPRFYFLSDDELLEILSQAKNPLAVQPHLRKCFENIYKLTFEDKLEITEMYSGEGECVRLIPSMFPTGQCETWLRKVEETMKNTVKMTIRGSLIDITLVPRAEWVLRWPGQIVIAGSQAIWTALVERAILRRRLSKCLKNMLIMLDSLRYLVKGYLSRVQRQVLCALIVIEVHARDVLANLIQGNVLNSNEFDWISQLRYYWVTEELKVRAVNAEFQYGYEYLGNSGRLVITPLTDRCYLTLTGALHLKFGGAPAGPAGTGKTETTKDLAKAFAIQCVVFNCSDQLDFMAMGKFFKGLASSGAWACFDEFNRIDIEVLSVVAQQITTIQKAQMARAERFTFEGTDLELKPSCAVFITMNPGYAGRTELPDNLKALFRPVAMMVPDYTLIAEISLFSFGFTDARQLAGKITTTFKLSSEQLSTQDHYDFGMRAVKTVIAVAGNLKRELPTMDEKQIILRALKDVNVPKFLKDDLKLFRGIVSDLFPRMEAEAIDYGTLETSIRKTILSFNLQDVNEYVMKVIQLYETVVVRHGLMLVGPTGSGKTKCYEVLKDAMTGCKGEMSPSGLPFEAVWTYVLNPKSITMGQLYGEFDLQTHEWTDGILPSMVRLGAGATDNDKRWYVFDGPVDAVWIENMNTVLDDNKKLCLTSGEIIKMTEHMTMMFEVADLAVASPATVSRCGMVYLEPAILGIRPFINCWIKTLPELANLLGPRFEKLLYRYTLNGLQYLRENLKEIVTSVDSNILQSTFRLLDHFLKPLTGPDGKAPPGADQQNLMPGLQSGWVVFATIWSVGATVDHISRDLFSDWIRKKMLKHRAFPQFPAGGSVYDYRLHDGGFADQTEDGSFRKPSWVSWLEGLPDYHIEFDVRYSDIEVPTMDNVRSAELLGLLLGDNRNVLCIGPTGTGKTLTIMSKMSRNMPKKFICDFMSFSARTTAAQTQEQIESRLERRRRNALGPPVLRRQILFIDDFNMPALEVFGAQPPLELIRQYMDFGGWYDKKTVGDFKYLVDINLIAGMGPPGGGRNPVTARLLRHFHYVAFTELSMDSKKRIFGKILQFWIDRVPNHKELYDAMLSTTLEVFTVIEKELLPTPTKTHYTFNLRDLSKVFQGILMARPENIERLEDLIKLYYHENCRVYQDRLVNDTDREWFDIMIKNKISVNFNCDADSIIGEEVLLFGDFLRLQENRNYILMEDRGEISEVLKDKLEDYNANTTAPMNLVLFLDAISHVCRITRIVRQPLGNGLLLGMAGSGRQSLTRLSAFVLEYFCFQIELSKSYGNNEWREDLKNVMIKSGVYKRETVFLFSDTQIKAESFLEDLNNILNSGDVPNIYAVEDMEIINNAMKMAVAELGLQATKSNLFSCYLKIVRANLHVCITMSPIGELFRARLRQFPALVNCCTIDWFCDWPNSALESVGYQFLEKMPELGLSSGPVLEGIVYTCMTMHQSVIESNQRFAQELSRHVYITPTSYLELLRSYGAMFKKKKDEIVQQVDRLRMGLEKLLKTSEDVVVLQQDLVETQPRLVVAQQEAQTMVEQIEKDRAIAEVTMTDIDFEKTEAEKTAQVTEKIANEAKAELEKAMPALRSAEMSLKALNKGDISEVKALKKPPGGVVLVMEVLCLMKGVKPQKLPGNMPGEKIDDYWEPARGMLADPTNFLKSLLNYDKGALDERLIGKLKPYISNPDFTPKKIIKVSKACTSLCAWVHALYKWYFVNKEVEPKRMALAQAKQKEEEMNRRLARSKARMEQITNRLDKLEQNLKETNDFRDELEDKALKCQQRLDRAFQLLGGLASEKTRWAETITALTLQLDNIVGDILISAGAVAYLAPFTDDYRRSLLSYWQHIIDDKGVPHTPDCDPVTILGEPVVIRQWQLDGLPMDYLSTENAILVTHSSRWPLFIDPQRQANIWLKKTWRERSLNIVKLSDKDLMRVIEGAISFGQTVLIENVGEELDPSLDPVLAKALFLQNGVECIKLGDTVIPYHNEFRLFITTTLPNPRYSPELCIKVLLVNFALVASGLQDQLLSITVIEELPELEESRSRIVVSSAQMKAELKSLEDKILQMISSTVGSPVDDLVLIATLDESNLKSKDIKEKVKTAAETQEKIEVIRVQFIPVAVRAQILFFCVSDLANVDPMYQYSLDWFTTVFVNSIAVTEKTEDIHARTKIINEHFTLSLFANICRSLFEKNKLQFAFLLCCRIMMNDNKIDMFEWNLFLAGGSPLRDIPKPNVVWLTERSWMETLSLESIPKWKPFVEHFIEDFSLYKTIVDSQEPHREQLPEPWESQLDLFEKMMLIKCLRPDKVTNAMQNFISIHLEPQFIEPQASDIEAMFKESSPLTPLIFVLSPGTDPAAELYKFAHKTKMSKRISSISLGQGQGPVAETMFIAAKDSGNWVFFQNCHLSPSWMPRLEYLVDRVSPETVHKDFRVWLTSTPSPDFPVAILQKGSKMTIEPPRGVKANLLRAYAGQVTEYIEFLNSDNPKAQNFKWLLFSLCLFHGVCLERRKFGPLGFNIPYEFTDGDLRICISQLHMFLLEYDDIPFKVLTYTAGQINYGGRVTDDWDRRCIMNILNDYYAPEVVVPNYYFDEQMCYYQLVEKTPIADYIIYIKQLPVNDNPAIFGLHGNADITCAQAETYSSLAVLLSLQPKQVGTEGTNQDDVTKHLAEVMLTQVPAPFSNIPQLQERYPVLYNESLNTVLIQEVMRFNKLLLIIHSSLKDLLKALAGFVVMSEALETMATSLFTNAVPQLWAAKAYPSLKPLGTWVTDLQQRIQFIERWISDGIPKRFWISGFYFPQAFLTGCLQNFARKYIISIDSINYKFEILSETPEERPPDGCIIYGLFLEGARWDPALQQLADNLPKELYTEMPSIYLIPEEFHHQPAHTYMCPIYKTLLRAGVLSTTGHSTNFILAVEVPTANPESHWIKRGVALFCALNY